MASTEEEKKKKDRRVYDSFIPEILTCSKTWIAGKCSDEVTARLVYYSQNKEVKWPAGTLAHRVTAREGKVLVYSPFYETFAVIPFLQWKPTPKESVAPPVGPLSVGSFLTYDALLKVKQIMQRSESDEKFFQHAKEELASQILSTVMLDAYREYLSSKDDFEKMHLSSQKKVATKKLATLFHAPWRGFLKPGEAKVKSLIPKLTYQSNASARSDLFDALLAQHVKSSTIVSFIGENQHGGFIIFNKGNKVVLRWFPLDLKSGQVFDHVQDEGLSKKAFLQKYVKFIFPPLTIPFVYRASNTIQAREAYDSSAILKYFSSDPVNIRDVLKLYSAQKYLGGKPRPPKAASLSQSVQYAKEQIDERKDYSAFGLFDPVFGGHILHQVTNVAGATIELARHEMSHSTNASWSWLTPIPEQGKAQSAATQQIVKDLDAIVEISRGEKTIDDLAQTVIPALQGKKGVNRRNLACGMYNAFVSFMGNVDNILNNQNPRAPGAINLYTLGTDGQYGVNPDKPFAMTDDLRFSDVKKASGKTELEELIEKAGLDQLRVSVTKKTVGGNNGPFTLAFYLAGSGDLKTHQQTYHASSQAEQTTVSTKAKSAAARVEVNAFHAVHHSLQSADYRYKITVANEMCKRITAGHEESKAKLKEGQADWNLLPGTIITFKSDEEEMGTVILYPPHSAFVFVANDYWDKAVDKDGNETIQVRLIPVKSITALTTLHEQKDVDELAATSKSSAFVHTCMLVHEVLDDEPLETWNVTHARLDAYMKLKWAADKRPKNDHLALWYYRQYLDTYNKTIDEARKAATSAARTQPTVSPVRTKHVLSSKAARKSYRGRRSRGKAHYNRSPATTTVMVK